MKKIQKFYLFFIFFGFFNLNALTPKEYELIARNRVPEPMKEKLDYYYNYQKIVNNNPSWDGYGKYSIAKGILDDWLIKRDISRIDGAEEFGKVIKDKKLDDILFIPKKFAYQIPGTSGACDDHYRVIAQKIEGEFYHTHNEKEAKALAKFAEKSRYRDLHDGNIIWSNGKIGIIDTEPEYKGSQLRAIDFLKSGNKWDRAASEFLNQRIAYHKYKDWLYNRYIDRALTRNTDNKVNWDIYVEKQWLRFCFEQDKREHKLKKLEKANLQKYS